MINGLVTVKNLSVEDLERNGKLKAYKDMSMPELLAELYPISGGATTVFDADVELLAPTANFGEGEDAPTGHAAVTVEPRSSWLIRVQVGTTWTGTSPTLDVTVECSDDGGTTYRQALVLPQITEASAETNGQEFYFGIVIVPQSAAGQTTCLMRATTDAAGTTPNCGTVAIEAAGLDLPGNYPTGIVGRSLVSDIARRVA